MLHKINMPSYKARLEAILDFQRDLLSFACTAPVLPLTPAMLKNQFGVQIGPWLSKRCWRDSKGTVKQEFCEKLEKLIAHIAKNPSEGPDIVDAFDNDRDFYKHLDDPNFRFHYPGLTQDARDTIQPLMIFFYESILRTGFPACIHLGTPEKFTYAELLKEFYKANATLKVCPGCDGPRPRLSNAILGIKIDEEEANKKRSNVQVDHFFPKSFLPFFAIHFANLVPLCRDCNLDKWNKNPLGQCSGRGALRHTFVPFLKPATAHMEVIVSRNASKLPKVILRDIHQPSFQRMKNLDDTFELSNKWEHHLEGWIESIVFQIESPQSKGKSNHQKIERRLKESLKTFATAQDEYIGQWPYLLVQKGYAKYALGDHLELETLIDQVMSSNAPNPKRRW